MMPLPVAFRIVVLIAVTLTGGGFGTLAGMVYSEEQYWWVGTITGGGSGIFLAWVYLRVLARFSSDYTKGSRWLVGTGTAVGCGIVCTLLVHGVMILLTYDGQPPANDLGNSIYGIAVTIGLIMGAGAGLIVGGICSLIYIYLPKASKP